jgi:hypothetical protein
MPRAGLAEREANTKSKKAASKTHPKKEVDKAIKTEEKPKNSKSKMEKGCSRYHNNYTRKISRHRLTYPISNPFGVIISVFLKL